MEGCNEIPRFAEDTQFLQVIGYLTEGEEIQKDLTELSKWTNKWQMNFSVGKCGVSIGGNYLYQACMMLNLELVVTAQEDAWGHHRQFSEIVSSVCNVSQKSQ